MWGRFSPLHTETANESKDRPIARNRIVRISIRLRIERQNYKKNGFREKKTKRLLPDRAEYVFDNRISQYYHAVN